MRRQFGAPPMPRQLFWANEYVRRFGGRIELGRSPADPVRAVDMLSIIHMDPMTRAALDEMDDAVMRAAEAAREAIRAETPMEARAGHRSQCGCDCVLCERCEHCGGWACNQEIL